MLFNVCVTAPLNQTTHLFLSLKIYQASDHHLEDLEDVYFNVLFFLVAETMCKKGEI